MDLFYAATTILVGNGEKTPFWDAPWLHGDKPKDVAPLIFSISTRKRWNVKNALQDNAWIAKIDMEATFSIAHVRQYLSLWSRLSAFVLNPGVMDEISWNLTENGTYSSKSAYKAQFYGSIAAPIGSSVWKIWAPPKIKFFSWLFVQDRIWTSDRLERRHWDNCGNCPLCNRVLESVEHLFVHCRFSIRIWALIKDWLGLHLLFPNTWTTLPLIDWWNLMTKHKGMASITLLVTWEIWNERNARVFKNKHAPPTVIFDKIRNEARLWALAGAKHVNFLMPRE